MVKLQ